MADRPHGDSNSHSEAFHEPLRDPLQEIGDQNTVVAELLRSLLQNPDLLAPVEALLRQRIKEGIVADPPRRNRLQAIISGLVAMACGSYSGARIIFVFLLTTLSDIVKMKPEIPREERAEFDEMKRKLGEVKLKQKKVQHDAEKMEENIQKAFENDYKISRPDNKELAVGQITATCDLDSCENGLSYSREVNDRLQLEAKEAIGSVRKFLITGAVTIIGVVFVAALAAGFLYHWGGQEKEFPRARRSVYDDDDDEDVKKKGSTTYLVLTASLFVAILVIHECKRMARTLINNKKLLAESEEFRKTDLKKAELFQKDLRQDVEVKLPLWKNQLDVLDIEVSLYASLHPHCD